MFLSLLLQATQAVSITKPQLTAIYITLGGTIFSAILSAFIAYRAANKSAETAKDLKDRDYRDDFYKKIIAKRFKVWEEAEEFVNPLTETLRDSNDGLAYFAFFDSGDDFDKVIDRMLPFGNKALWLGRIYASELQRFDRILIDIRMDARYTDKFKETGHSQINDELLLKIGKERFNDIDYTLSRLVAASSIVIKSLHDVDAFFDNMPNKAEDIGLMPKS